MLYRVHFVWAGFELTTLVVIGTDCIGSCKFNYHMITTTMAPSLFCKCSHFVEYTSTVYLIVKPELPLFMWSPTQVSHINFYMNSIMSYCYFFITFILKLWKNNSVGKYDLKSCNNVKKTLKNSNRLYL